MQQQSFYDSRFPNSLSKRTSYQYRSYSIYSSLQNRSQFNDYNYPIRSLAANLNAFTPSCEPFITDRYARHISRQNSNNYRTNHFAGATNSTRAYYCEICRISCTGYSSYQAHLHGLKHKRTESDSQHQTMNQNTLRCELCNINCTGINAYEAHLYGSKHYQAVQLNRKSAKTISTKLCQPSVSNNDLQIAMNNEEKQSKENNMNFLGMEYIETSYDNQNMPTFYYCKLCDCNLNGSKARNDHLIGKRHQISYKQKVNTNIQVSNNINSKLSNPKQCENESVENINKQSIENSNDQVNIDEDTKYLMKLHEQIIPAKAFLDTIEQFICAVEVALKSCSDQLNHRQSSGSDDILRSINTKSLCSSISRVGTLAKNLLIKGDRFFHLVFICTVWPTMNLFEQIYSILFDNFNETWQRQINILCQKQDEIICVYANTLEGPMSVSISFTSLSIQQQEHAPTSEKCLSKTNCLKALVAINSVQWFQKHASRREHASVFIRCLRYKAKISPNWKSLSSEIIEILIENIWSQSISTSCVFRRILECLSGGLLLSNDPGLRIPWETNTINNIFNKLTNQKRNDISQEAQTGLRFMTFGKLNHWFEQYDVAKVMKSAKKRSCSGHDNQTLAKRQCIELVNLSEK